MYENHTTVIGNVTRDPELRYMPSGRALVSFGLANNRRYQSNGEWKEETSFFDISAWGDLAENVANSLSKGDRVTVTGRLNQRSWETDQGEKRSKIEIVADDVAASMRFATVTVTKTPRNTDNTTNGNGRQPVAAAGTPEFDGSEEPF